MKGEFDNGYSAVQNTEDALNILREHAAWSRREQAINDRTGFSQQAQICEAVADTIEGLIRNIEKRMEK